MKKISVIGSGVIDVLVQGVSKKVFEIGSMPVNSTKISFGGDALNESIILSKLGEKVELISSFGNDEASIKILSFLNENKVDTSKVIIKEDLVSSINIVLVDESGERFFLTNPNSSLRKLSLEDISLGLNDLGDIVSFAGMFISSILTIDKMKALFAQIKALNKTLCVDMTKRKNNESIKDIKDLLPYIDYIFPNEEEISLLTGSADPYENAKILIDNGVKCAVIKLGKKGCLVKTKDEEFIMPAKLVKNVIDTTGAGDSFAAGFIYGLNNGLSLKECANFAVTVSSFVVESLGAVDGIVSLDQVKERL